jgi:Capsular polysaccharide biosynthesis protein
MENNKNEEVEIDLLDLFYLIKSRLWIIILSGAIVAAAAGLISSFVLTPIYTSTTYLYILNKTPSLTNLTSLDDLQLGTQLTQDYMVLVKSRTVVNQVIDNLGMDISYEQMKELVSITNPPNTRILEISVNYPDAYMANEIVNEFADVSKKQIASIMDIKEPRIADKGVVATEPSSPNIKRNIIIGGLVGLIIAAGIIVVLYLMDDTIKNDEDIEKYLGISTLGLIPIEPGAAKEMQMDKKKRKKLKAHTR